MKTSPYLVIVSLLLPFIPSKSSFDSSSVHLCNRFFTFHSQSHQCQFILNLLTLYMRISQPIYRVHEVSKCVIIISISFDSTNLFSFILLLHCVSIITCCNLQLVELNRMIDNKENLLWICLFFLSQIFLLHINSLQLNIIRQEQI